MKPERKNKRGDTARANGAALKLLRRVAAMKALKNACRPFHGAAMYDAAAEAAERALMSMHGGFSILAQAGHANAPEARAKAWIEWENVNGWIIRAEAQARGAFIQAEEWAARRAAA